MGNSSLNGQLPYRLSVTCPCSIPVFQYQPGLQFVPLLEQLHANLLLEPLEEGTLGRPAAIPVTHH